MIVFTLQLKFFSQGLEPDDHGMAFPFFIFFLLLTNSLTLYTSLLLLCASFFLLMKDLQHYTPYWNFVHVRFDYPP